jgi:DNA-binding NarL/FixJ family response regulator
VEDHRTPVPDQVAFRIDFPAWLCALSRGRRRIAEALAVGHSTSQVARRLRVSPGRVNQVRRELHDSWQKYHAGPAAPAG